MHYWDASCVGRTISGNPGVLDYDRDASCVGRTISGIRESWIMIGMPPTSAGQYLGNEEFLDYYRDASCVGMTIRGKRGVPGLLSGCLLRRHDKIREKRSAWTMIGMSPASAGKYVGREEFLDYNR